MNPKNSTSCDFALTITLRPSTFVDSCQTQFDKLSQLIKDRLQGCKLSLIAELTKQWNVHFHGFISVPTARGHPSKYIHDRLRHAKIGFIKVDQITDFNGWKDYIRKDLHITKDYISYPIVKDDYEVFISTSIDEVRSEEDAEYKIKI